MTCYEVDFRLVKGFSESYQSFLGVWLVAFWESIANFLFSYLFYLLHSILSHRRLQSCVGTWARLGYVVFDAQLQKVYFVTTLYAIRMSVCA